VRINEQSLGELGDVINPANIQLVEVLERDGRKSSRKNI
jgi:hypothetical protein